MKKEEQMNQYVETEDGWLDTATGLEWARQTHLYSTWPESHYLGDGWRVPTVDELCGVVDWKQFNPATRLPGMKSNFYWSASTYAPNPHFAWLVTFDAGSVSVGSKTGSGYIRAVRGPRDVPLKMNW